MANTSHSQIVLYKVHGFLTTIALDLRNRQDIRHVAAAMIDRLERNLPLSDAVSAIENAPARVHQSVPMANTAHEQKGVVR